MLRGHRKRIVTSEPAKRFILDTFKAAATSPAMSAVAGRKPDQRPLTPSNRGSPKSLPQIGHPIMKTHDFGRTLKVSPHATPAANKFGCSAQGFKCQLELVVLDVLMKVANQAIELLSIVGCRGG
jgi:hypothetical protein